MTDGTSANATPIIAIGTTGGMFVNASIRKTGRISSEPKTIISDRRA